MPQEEFFPSKDVTKDNKEKHIGDMHIEFTADKMDMCAPGLASRIHRMILRSLIPQLHHRLTERVLFSCVTLPFGLIYDFLIYLIFFVVQCVMVSLYLLHYLQWNIYVNRLHSMIAMPFEFT